MIFDDEQLQQGSLLFGYAKSLNENIDQVARTGKPKRVTSLQHEVPHTAMTDSNNPNDTMELLRKMWSNMGIPIPGMAVPTLDVGELEKRIADLKAVEGWLKMNLNMLQLHIQGLEMQCNTLTAMKNFGQSAESATANNPFTNPNLWPWNVMQQAASDKSTPSDTEPDKD